MSPLTQRRAPAGGSGGGEEGARDVLSPLLWRLALQPQKGSGWVWGGTGHARHDVGCHSDPGSFEVQVDSRAEAVGIAEA